MPFSQTDEISTSIADALTELFAETGWEVFNRGTRLEIRHMKEFGKRDDEAVRLVIQDVLGEKYEIAVVSKN